MHDFVALVQEPCSLGSGTGGGACRMDMQTSRALLLAAFLFD